MKRRIFIIGQGNIGTFLGVALKQCHDNEVCHFVRNRSGKRQSIILDFRDRRKRSLKIPRNSHYDYTQVDTPGELRHSKFIFIPVRHGQWEGVVEDIRPFLQENQTIVLCGNVLDEFEWFENNIPCPYLFAFPNFGGAVTDDKLQGWLTEKFTLGTPTPRFEKELQELRNLLTEVGFNPRVEMNIKGWLMTHFACNAGMLAEAERQGGFQKMAKSFSGLSRMYLLMRDCVDTVYKLGVDVEKYSEGRSVYRPIWWNVLKSYLIFLIPGLAKNADATRDTKEWLSYLSSLQQLAQKNHLPIPGSR